MPGSLELDSAPRAGLVCNLVRLVLPAYQQTGLARLHPGSPKVGHPQRYRRAPQFSEPTVSPFFTAVSFFVWALGFLASGVGLMLVLALPLFVNARNQHLSRTNNMVKHNIR